MSPDAHLYIHRAEQAARARAQPVGVPVRPRPRRRLPDLIRNLARSHPPVPRTRRRLVWRRG